MEPPDGLAIHIQVHMIESINKLFRTSRQLVEEFGREPTSEETPRMHIPIDRVRGDAGESRSSPSR